MGLSSQYKCKVAQPMQHTKQIEGNSTVTELQIRDFGLLFNHFVLYSYNLSQFEYFYMVQRYQCHHLKTQNLAEFSLV